MHAFLQNSISFALLYSGYPSFKYSKTQPYTFSIVGWRIYARYWNWETRLKVSHCINLTSQRSQVFSDSLPQITYSWPNVNCTSHVPCCTCAVSAWKVHFCKHTIFKSSLDELNMTWPDWVWAGAVHMCQKLGSYHDVAISLLSIRVQKMQTR